MLKNKANYFYCANIFLNIEDVDIVRIQAIDRLGVDLRVKAGDYTDEYR